MAQATAKLAGDRLGRVGGCRASYLDASGEASVNWPGPTRQYRRATRRFDPAPYQLRTFVATVPTH